LFNIYQAIKRGLFYLLFDLNATLYISEIPSPISKRRNHKSLIFPLALLLSILFSSGCTSSKKSQNTLSISSEVTQEAIESVINKANYELTQAHSKLISDNRDNRIGPQDYTSLATYWWPNPDTESGLPYIRKDGRVNPESMTELSNLPQLILMSRRIEILSAAYRFTGNEIYAKRAIEQLNVWFIDSKTSMLPHLEHAQLIRGQDTGRSYGVIDTWWLVRVVDSLKLLNRSGAWSDETDRKLKNWFTHYANWLSNSSFGKAEKAQKNNHGTWYDVQFITFARYLGWDQFVSSYLDSVTRGRVSEQIQFSGKQRFEASRTRPEHYSIYNLYGLLKLARTARENGMDIVEPDFLFSGNLRNAYRVLIDQVGQKNPASFTKQFDETDTARIWYLLLLEAHLLFDEPYTRHNLVRFVTRFPELHSRYMSASPEYLLALC
jgi:hypothetical protein